MLSTRESMHGQSLLDGFAYNRFEMNRTRHQFNVITRKKNIPAFFDHIRSATTWFGASDPVFVTSTLTSASSERLCWRQDRSAL